MKQRIITSLLIILAVIPPVILGGIYLKLLILFICALSSIEIALLSESKFKVFIGLLSFVLVELFSTYLSTHFPSDVQYAFLSIYIIILFTILLIDNKYKVTDIMYQLIITIILITCYKGVIFIHSLGFISLAYLIISCYTTDIGAYFIGIKFGKNKMIPEISPNKTWEGAIGGYFTSLIISSIFNILFIPQNLKFIYFIIALFIPIVSQIGDLAFSAIKREKGIKDYSNIFPGHGGLLDRVDSLLFSIILFYFINLIFLYI